ncbi:hypothetical protein EJB05_00323, partial [Eragrostis curvula]
MSDQDYPPHGCMPGDVQDLELPHPHALISDGTGDLGVRPQANVQDSIAMLENCSDLDSTTDEHLENLVLSWSISSIRMKPKMIPKIHGRGGLSPQEYLRSDMYDLFNLDALDVSLLRCFTLHLMKEMKGRPCAFVDPAPMTIDNLHDSRKEVVQLLVRAIRTYKDKEYIMFPHNTGGHWALVVISVKKKKCCQQPSGSKLCGFYVAQHMLIIAEACISDKSIDMNENSGFKLSLFERFISSGFKKYMLTTQYQMHPEISSLANTYFYEGKLSNAELINLDVMKLRFNNYMFVNVEPDRVPDVILSLITPILKASKPPECQGSKLKVGVICSKEKQKVQGYNNHGPITLSIHSMDEMGKYYDILIVAADGIETSKNNINYMITRARKYMWIVGNETVLAKNEMWKMLIESAKQKGCFKESTSHLKFSSITKNTWEILISTLGIIIPQGNAPLREFTLYGQTHNGIPLTTPVRDQRGENHCTLLSILTTMEFQNKHKSASFVPPIIF